MSSKFASSGMARLVAVRRGSSKLFYLGLVQWLRVEENNKLFVGVRLFPGIARAVAVRPANFGAPPGIKGFERALLLPELPAPSTPATLILPTGWYQAGRFVEVHSDQKQVAKLVNLLEKRQRLRPLHVDTRRGNVSTRGRCPLVNPAGQSLPGRSSCGALRRLVPG